MGVFGTALSPNKLPGGKTILALRMTRIGHIDTSTRLDG